MINSQQLLETKFHPRKDHPPSSQRTAERNQHHEINNSKTYYNLHFKIDCFKNPSNVSKLRSLEKFHVAVKVKQDAIIIQRLGVLSFKHAGKGIIRLSITYILFQCSENTKSLTPENARNLLQCAPKNLSS